MASLHFKGKSAVWNHHLSVPYHTFEKDKKVSLKGDDDSENLIIEGDNLLALKALLPKFQGKVKCVYIDPPYNTGNEGWVYNDNVNNPLIKSWVGQTVGKEGEDFTRHDKWLCMMTPRLKLLRELLTEDGVIFISINDIEQHHLRSLLDEIFGEENFITQFVWNNEGNIDNQSKVKINHEYIFCYTKNEGSFPKPKIIDPNIEETSKLFNDEIENSITKNGPANPVSKIVLPVGFPTVSESVEIRAQQVSYPYIHQPIVSKKHKLTIPTTLESGWSSKRLLELFIANGCVPILDSEEKETSFAVTDTGAIYAYKKRAEDQGHVLSVIRNVGTTKQTSNMLESWGIQFDYPKPVLLVRYLLQIVTSADKEAIILDSFAGSGTTANAVLELNLQDTGHRKYILVEMEDYAKTTTAERVGRVIGNNKLHSGFTYFKLGSPIDAENILSGNLPDYNEFAKYVYYLATGRALENESKIREKDYFVGKHNDESIYLLYHNNIEELKKFAVTLDWAKKVTEKDKGRKVVYAPACYLDEEYLAQFNIIFVGIPYNLFERA